MVYIVISTTDNSIIAVFDHESAAQEFVTYTYKGAPYEILEFQLNEFLGGVSYWRILCSVVDKQWACQRKFGIHRYVLGVVSVKVQSPLLLQVYVKSDNYSVALDEGKRLVDEYLSRN